jgi:NTE family protein
LAEAAPEIDNAPLPRGSRRGIGLCLSGGGFRATLFHLGALRRLNELGILARADFRTIASVSGGSITSAALATALARRPNATLSATEWELEVEAPLRAFTKTNMRTGPFLRRLLPWNLWRSETTVEALARRYEQGLTSLRLVELPAQPDFLILATDMAYGVSWVFSRERMGDYRAGYRRTPDDFPLARAVAASACFPPLFGPLPMRLPGDPGDVRLTDGGAYDNLGLEPVWKNHAVVLVSDAGGLFTAEGDRGLLWRIPRYQGIQEQQARALRKRWLMASFNQGSIDGTYWGVGGASSRYGEGLAGYSKELAHEVIAQIRTDLDCFSHAEAAVLENHGYLLAQAALRRHVPELLPDSAPPPRPPHPEWLPPARCEPEIRAALAQSGRRKMLGRAR